MPIEYHKTAHLGIEWTLSEMRKRTWITKARNLIKGIKRSCVTCRKLSAKGRVQRMANLSPNDVNLVNLHSVM